MHVSANGRGNAWHVANEEAHAHNAPPFELLGYLHSGGFIESVFENWESEFLQMGLFVFLTTYLKQKGSSESKPIDDKDPVEEDPAEKKRDPNAPWPVRRGGIVLALYQRSLFIALLLLFVCSFLLHGLGGVRQHNEDAIRHGESTVTWLAAVEACRRVACANGRRLNYAASTKKRSAATPACQGAATLEHAPALGRAMVFATAARDSVRSPSCRPRACNLPPRRDRARLRRDASSDRSASICSIGGGVPACARRSLVRSSRRNACS